LSQSSDDLWRIAKSDEKPYKLKVGYQAGSSSNGYYKADKVWRDTKAAVKASSIASGPRYSIMVAKDTGSLSQYVGDVGSWTDYIPLMVTISGGQDTIKAHDVAIAQNDEVFAIGFESDPYFGH
jgi:hypothetical protein